eukprot:477845_1
MQYYVWNFGYIPEIDEMKYIEVICNNHWNQLTNIQTERNSSKFDEYQSLFVLLIHKSQQKLREWYNEISICSLRDVQRANKFFTFFYGKFQKYAKINPLDRAIVMCLSQCYYYRLPSEYRKKYALFVEKQLNSAPDYFVTTINEEHTETVSMLDVPKGIATNKVFKENIFIMLTCIITSTPVFVVGAPGSSKTLSMLTLEHNLDKSTKSKQLTAYGITDYFVNHFQCSKLTTSELIAKKWFNAAKIQKLKHANTDIPNQILFLDEMGLA